jgi:hypothetical protein
MICPELHLKASKMFQSGSVETAGDEKREEANLEDHKTLSEGSHKEAVCLFLDTRRNQTMQKVILHRVTNMNDNVAFESCRG